MSVNYVRRFQTSNRNNTSYELVLLRGTATIVKSSLVDFDLALLKAI